MKPVTLQHGPLRLVFERGVDRWSHRIALQSEFGEQTVFLASCEGDSNQAWPPSPSLQEIHQHDLPSGLPAILGVGKSGASHWSASFEPLMTRQPDRIRVELACLTHSLEFNGPRELGPASAYSLASGIEIVEMESDELISTSGESLKLIRLETPTSSLVVFPLAGENWGTKLQLVDRQLQVIPTELSTQPRIPTRWGFEIEESSHPS